ncbi:hypothetical protein A3F29_03220 [Candidatus Roizmanbacteria bacterium RIFCSPHIGHO2_12_FULL_33_9]|uniref:Uncharacterized protein n=1 Tax=Candidatus Roizmanbacteria bacterium RIFCSPHIGHO2_12_FULL_33_9 TaxID=1802045 RepID=A0A1F7HIH8_9BACT|nr:MAG: hypothetical protein A3F29_03220 [Candidatus Roizmanbacteria bacterium RIFCSPHIGHO2_12_FULL_33_9]
MKNKTVLKVELLILIILIAIFSLSVIYAYINLKPSENKVNPVGYMEPTSKLYPVKPSSNPQDQKSILACSQIDKASFDSVTKKYIVALGSNSSDATWSIQNNLNCSPIGGSGSIFTTNCDYIGKSKATVSYGENQSTCEFTTVP